MRRRKNGGLLRRPQTWLSVISLLVALAAALAGGRDRNLAAGGGDGRGIFAAFAGLGVDLEEVVRMRNSPLPPQGKPRGAPWRTIVKVIDGDSVELDGAEMVRLIGIDAPEASVNRKMGDDLRKMGIPGGGEAMAALGRKAGLFARRLAEGRRCWLEYERRSSDQYGRTLAYVHLQDGTILNEAMLSAGYARAYLNQAFAYKKRYILLQVEARRGGRGLWAGGGPQGLPGDSP